MLRNIIERERPRPEVQIHSDPAAGGCGHGHALLVVLEQTGRVGAVQAPRLGVVSELGVAAASAPVHVLIAHADGHPSCAPPLYLPVAASGHTGSAQHLGPAGEARRVFRVGLRVQSRGHRSPAVGEAQIRVGCVRVQREVTVIWTRQGDAVRHRVEGSNTFFKIRFQIFVRTLEKICSRLGLQVVGYVCVLSCVSNRGEK